MQPGEKVRIIYRCRRCEKRKTAGAVRRIEYTVAPNGCLWVPEAPQFEPRRASICPNCKTDLYVDSAVVNGRLVPDQKCGARCVNAVGPSCDCACGGANHGKGYTFHVESTAGVG